MAETLLIHRTSALGWLSGSGEAKDDALLFGFNLWPMSVTEV
ncbi:MAG: hypothetical protein O2992_01725 [Gemmatimonadetes bacterium]|jgi:hypothetical protein|nr:hypothetical protein [Gemmatimonadota bacterium]